MVSKNIMTGQEYGQRDNINILATYPENITLRMGETIEYMQTNTYPGLCYPEIISRRSSVILMERHVDLVCDIPIHIETYIMMDPSVVFKYVEWWNRVENEMHKLWRLNLW